MKNYHDHDPPNDKGFQLRAGTPIWAVWPNEPFTATTLTVASALGGVNANPQLVVDTVGAKPNVWYSWAKGAISSAAWRQAVKGTRSKAARRFRELELLLLESSFEAQDAGWQRAYHHLYLLVAMDMRKSLGLPGA